MTGEQAEDVGIAVGPSGKGDFNQRTSGNVDQAIVGGVVNASHQIDFYFQSSPWATLPYGKQTQKN